MLGLDVHHNDIRCAQREALTQRRRGDELMLATSSTASRLVIAHAETLENVAGACVRTA